MDLTDLRSAALKGFRQKQGTPTDTKLYGIYLHIYLPKHNW